LLSKAQALILDFMNRSLSTTETAGLTSPPTTRFTVEREIKRGNLTAQKIGRTWVIDEAEAQRWASGFIAWRTQRSASPRRES